MSNYPTIIGRFEHVDLIDNLKCVPVKIDTGAYGSAIHAIGSSSSSRYS